MSFTVEVSLDKDGSSVLLKDLDAGTEATILPECGAILNSFSIPWQKGRLNVIDGYDGATDFKQHAEAKGFRGCKLSPYVCRIPEARYQFAGNEYHIGKFKVQNASIHGLLYDLPFFLKSTHSGATHASATLSHSYGGDDPGYPFAYTCTIEYKLESENALTLTTTVQNNSHSLIPIADGWHPYFKLNKRVDELQLEFQSMEILEFNDGLVPTGKYLPYTDFNGVKKINGTFFDNSFTLNFAECQPLCVLRDPEKKVQVEILPSKSYPFLQIYTPPHRNSIAIENLSAAPNAFNNQMGLAVMGPGESRSFQTKFKISSWT